MKRLIVVTGSRNYPEFGGIECRLAVRYANGGILMHGGCKGADTIAANYFSKLTEWQVHCVPYHSDDGLKGGPTRNQLMVDLAKVYREHGYEVIFEAFPMPDSRGTWDCVKRAKAAGFTVNVTEG